MILSGHDAIDVCKEDLMVAFHSGTVGVPVKGGEVVGGALGGEQPTTRCIEVGICQHGQMSWQ